MVEEQRKKRAPVLAGRLSTAVHRWVSGVPLIESRLETRSSPEPADALQAVVSHWVDQQEIEPADDGQTYRCRSEEGRAPSSPTFIFILKRLDRLALAVIGYTFSQTSYPIGIRVG